MQKEKHSSQKSDDWITVRDFTTDKHGSPLPKYEVKYVEDVDKAYVEDELVLLRETSSIGGESRISHLPREVFEEVTEL